MAPQDLAFVGKTERSRISNPRPSREHDPFVTRVSFHCPLHLRAWSDEAHVSDEHVPQLGQLVELVLAKESAGAGHTRVIVCGRGPAELFGIRPHCSELQN